MNIEILIDQIVPAIDARVDLFDTKHEAAFRLFNGFIEGYPALVIDLYGRTLLIHDYAQGTSALASIMPELINSLTAKLPWIQAVIVKMRNSEDVEEKNGKLLFGDKVDRSVRENGVRYALDLMLNRDAGFYLDTRNLRKWLKDNLANKSVLNAFAYTGSLGVAAYAGGASRVVHLDINKKFLTVAKTSYTLNGFKIDTKDFITKDFFSGMSQFRHTEPLFDAVILDPPFFAESARGRIDLEKESIKIINKVRPVIKDGGCLIVVNNALFLSGKEFYAQLESLTLDGYIKIEELIPVAEDIVGYEQTIKSGLPVDPAPFNHATKIAVLRFRRKS